jgi:hypothetical protein
MPLGWKARNRGNLKTLRKLTLPEESGTYPGNAIQFAIFSTILFKVHVLFRNLVRFDAAP